MATATMVTAAGAAMLLYYVLSKRLSPKDDEEDDNNDHHGDLSKLNRSVKRKILRRPAQAPATWFETMGTLSETLRFTYSETLGKWPIGDLAFGINYLMRRQGNLHVASVYAGNSSVQLKGPEIIVELVYFLRLLTLCMLFSKKPFPVFLESGGYSQEDVLLQEPKAGLLKPAFTILCDRSSRVFLLLIRGTHSIKDTLTAVTGAVVPFHHSVIHEGGISNLVLGYAHCGMVAAARWIAKLSTPSLLKALDEHPDYKIKVVGHSLGGGTAALLTYILRERKEFSSSTCVAFAPAACMTWDLAESGKHFITTIVNGSDLVPTFSTVSIDDLRSEVTASSWLNDLRDQVEQTRILNVVYRSASALGSRLPSIATAKARVAGAGALLRPVSSSTQIVMKRAQNVAQAVVRTRSSFSAWSCMGARRRSVGPFSNVNDEDDKPDQASQLTSRNRTSVDTQGTMSVEDSEVDELGYGCLRGVSGHSDTEEEEELIPVDHVSTSEVEDMTAGELWYELEKELQRQGDEDEANVQEVREEEEAAAKEITEEENTLLVDVGVVENKTSGASSFDASSEVQPFYPPGRIMHIVSVPVETRNSTSSASSSDDDGDNNQITTNIEEHVGIYETPRELYSKLRLSRTMINDHYMPMYRKMMEQLISELEKDEDYRTHTM
ncbi:hypothetical protein MKX01_035715 [Papaver californicum]|nr:hypothetical protein MKX01_035715 [Papaver californicum]